MSQSGGTRKCYHCKESGHMAKDCAMAPKAAAPAAPKPAAPAPAPVAAAPAASSSASSAAASASSGTRKCYHCGLSGHMAKDCAQAPKDGKAKKPAAAAAAAEPSFKDRLAEYKASNPEKKSFCYLCGREGHRERDCPKNSKRSEEKVCLRCGEADHIARICPTIANRTIYRQETKERAKGCYICGEDGHHAEECKELEVLAEEFPKFLAKLQSGMKLNIKVYNILIEKCSRALELNGALYLYEQMITRGVEANPDTWRHLEYVFDRSGKDQSKLTDIPMLKKRVQRLRDIVHAHRHVVKTEEITDNVVEHLIAYLRDDKARAAAEKCASMFDLAKLLKGKAIAGLAEPLSATSARAVLGTLKSLGRYHQKSKSAEFDLTGSDVSKPGKWFKVPDVDPVTGKKKVVKVKKSTKKKREKKDKLTKIDADGDEDMAGSDDDAEEAETKPKKEKAASVKKEKAASVKKTEGASKKRKSVEPATGTTSTKKVAKKAKA